MQTFKQYLNEIGNSRRAYPYKFVNGIGSKEASFKTDAGFTYRVTFWLKNYFTMEVIFDTKESREFLTGSGLSEAFRVMATVIAITKDAIQQLKKEGTNITTIVFESSKWKGPLDTDNSKVEKQRKKLYLAFAKKELHASKIKASGGKVYLDVSGN